MPLLTLRGLAPHNGPAILDQLTARRARSLRSPIAKVIRHLACVRLDALRHELRELEDQTEGGTFPVADDAARQAVRVRAGPSPSRNGGAGRRGSRHAYRFHRRVIEGVAVAVRISEVRHFAIGNALQVFLRRRNRAQLLVCCYRRAAYGPLYAPRSLPQGTRSTGRVRPRSGCEHRSYPKEWHRNRCHDVSEGTGQCDPNHFLSTRSGKSRHHIAPFLNLCIMPAAKSRWELDLIHSPLLAELKERES